MGTSGFWIRDSTDTSTVFACDDDNVGLYKEIVLTSSSPWAGPHNRIPYSKQEVDDLLTTRITTDHTKLYMESLGHYIRDSSDNSTVIHIDDDDITFYKPLSSNSDITTSGQLVATGQRTWNPSSKGIYLVLSGSGNDAAIDLCSAVQNSWSYIDFTHAGND